MRTSELTREFSLYTLEKNNIFNGFLDGLPSLDFKFSLTKSVSDICVSDFQGNQDNQDNRDNQDNQDKHNNHDDNLDIQDNRDNHDNQVTLAHL